MTKDKKTDISVNITTHKEGLLLYKTLRSIDAGIKLAIKEGIDIEVNLSLDCADNLTAKIAKDFMSNVDYPANVYEIREGDLGLSRNFLINKSRGKYISFFDGDDFFTENYLHAAFKLAESIGGPVVLSPQFMINFEGDEYLIEKLDSNSPDFNPMLLMERNYFISQVFVHKEIYQKVQYQPNRGGYGMEDWHWNCEVIASGYRFINVPEAIFFYRRKNNGSLLREQVANGVVLRGTRLFDRNTVSKMKTLVTGDSPEIVEMAPGNFGTTKRLFMKKQAVYNYAKGQYILNRELLQIAVRFIKKHINSNGAKGLHGDYLMGRAPQRLLDEGVTDEHISLWGKLNKVEPMIRPSHALLHNIPIVRYSVSSRVAEVYQRLCKENQNTKFTDLVLVPHLVHGGADYAAITLIETLVRKGAKVIVLTTMHVDSPWLSKLRGNPDVLVIESNTDLQNTNDEQKINLIIKLLQHWQIKRLNTVNAEIGYKIASNYHRVLHDQNIKHYLHTYAFDMTDDGYIFNYIPNGLVDAYKGVEKYITDSSAYKNQIQLINGFSEDRVSELYLPVSSKIVPKSKYRKTKKVLWAGRLHDSKLVEVMLEVGSLLEEHGIILDVYGVLSPPYDKDKRFLMPTTGISNVRYCGEFDGYASLPIDEYDLFLMTTKNEGMPNVILEACAANIFIVAPDVGGIGECIESGKNGIIVKDKFNPESYVAAIVESYDGNLFAKEKNIRKANKKVAQRHSWETYEKAIESTMM